MPPVDIAELEVAEVPPIEVPPVDVAELEVADVPPVAPPIEVPPVDVVELDVVDDPPWLVDGVPPCSAPPAAVAVPPECVAEVPAFPFPPLEVDVPAAPPLDALVPLASPQFGKMSGNSSTLIDARVRLPNQSRHVGSFVMIYGMGKSKGSNYALNLRHVQNPHKSRRSLSLPYGAGSGSFSKVSKSALNQSFAMLWKKKPTSQLDPVTAIDGMLNSRQFQLSTGMLTC